MSLQHGDPLVHGHGDLVGAYRHEAAREALVVLHQEADGDHEVVDVVEDQGALLGVGVLLLEEGLGVVAPVAEGVEVVRGVVPVVEAVAVALRMGGVSFTGSCILGLGWTYRHVDQRDAGAEVGVRLVPVYQGVLAPVSHHQADAHQR